MEKIHCHKNDYENKLKEVVNWDIAVSNKGKVVLFFNDYELGKVTGKRGANPEGNLLRNLYLLKVSLENIKQENPEMIEKFLNDLLKDKIKYKGRAYALRTKKSILKMLSVFLEWKHKEKSVKMCKLLNIQISLNNNEIEILTDAEVDKLIVDTLPPDKKFLLAVLNSSGMRAEEFHNCRYSDFKMPEGEDMFVQVTVKNQFSKTKGRTIKLYDKKVLPIVKKYLAIRLNEGMKPDDAVFPLTYAGTRKWMSRLGMKVLNKNVHYHLWRHTSATRLASSLNRQQLCIYFGWKFSSSMPDVYIQRAGVDMDDVESKFKSTNYEDQQEQIKGLDQQIQSLLNHEAKTMKIQQWNSKITKLLIKSLSENRNADEILKELKDFTI